MNSSEDTANHVQHLVTCHLNSDDHRLMVSFPSNLAFSIHLTACILSAIISVATICLNSLVVLTFWRTPPLKEKDSLYLVMILSMVDAGTGIFCYPSLTLSLATDLMGIPQCWITHVQSRLFMFTSVLSQSIVSTISTERYLGVVHPFFHRTKVTKDKLLMVLLCFWSISTLVLVLDVFVHDAFQFFATFSITSLVLNTVFVYTVIAFVAVRSKMRQCEGQIHVNSNKEGQENDDRRKSLKAKLYFLKQLKLAKSCFLIALSYLMCYMPTLIVFGAMPNSLEDVTFSIASRWCLLFLMCNSIANSVIFFWGSAALRKAATVVLRSMYR
ncbi:neuromedin-U receptor 2-like [Dendronephthya gigantea]|uniref:neuromedin-U receptor 2-like n=1 Tax=Dendronephthya gigantea TaxID=151771 RepID=UPI00106BD658|nr:neuromedin-U receptor 2-like [Dendronephthya gigantea]